jgi:hypothetical protein
MDQHILTSFPDDNSKHIDYIITYKKLNDKDDDKGRIEKLRDQFFKKLIRESFDIYYLDLNLSRKNKSNVVFALLHCPNERLLKEAEIVRLEMKLKNVININFGQVLVKLK